MDEKGVYQAGEWTTDGGARRSGHGKGGRDRGGAEAAVAMARRQSRGVGQSDRQTAIQTAFKRRHYG